MSDQENNDSDVETSEYIKLKVIGQKTAEFHFRIKMHAQMSKLKIMYSELVGIPVSSLRFLFDGCRINDDETPQQLELVDEDIIEVYVLEFLP